MCPTSRWWFSLQRMPTISTFAVQYIRTYFLHHIVEEGVELILMESIRINLAMEDKKKEEDDRNKGKDGRRRKSNKE